jgi:tetratricopeptide (TPR) repeat protein
MKPPEAPLKWVAAITAVIALVLGVNNVAKVFAEIGERKRQVAELTAVATAQRDSGDFAAAFASLDEAAKVADEGSYFAKLSGRLDPLRVDVRTAQEDVAMAWLRAASVPAGKTFSDMIDPLLPVITRGLVGASGARKADLLAHRGWAHFLMSRDGRDTPDPADSYREAIAIDAANPFAHANLGHLIVWRRGPADEASAHFAKALASGREREYVRRMQLASFMNYGSPGTDAGLLRAVDEMRRNGEPIDESTRRYMFGVYYHAFNSPEQLRLLVEAIPPADQIATMQALYFGSDFDPGRVPLRDAMIALLQEAAGRPAEALATWKSVQAVLGPDDDGRVAEMAKAAVTRLSK